MALNYMGVAAINFVAALLSIPVIAAGIWLSTQADNACVQILQWPVIALGVAVLAVGLAGFVAALWRLPWLLLAYLVAMFVVVVALACLAVFVFAVTTGSSGHRVPSREFLEYDLDDYSGWLRARLDAPGRWDRIKACLAATPTCSDFNGTYATAQDLFTAAPNRMSPLQSGLLQASDELRLHLRDPDVLDQPHQRHRRPRLRRLEQRGGQVLLLVRLLQGRPAAEPPQGVAPRRPHPRRRRCPPPRCLRHGLLRVPHRQDRPTLSPLQAGLHMT
jgi:hypothetical protein